MTYQIDTLKNLQNRTMDAGMRLCRIVFKTTAEQKKAGIEAEDSKACFVPLMSESIANAFAAKHPQIIIGFLEELQDKVARKVWVTSRRSPNADDFGIDKLAEIYNETTISDRITKEQVKAAWNSDLGLQFVNYLGRARNIDLSISENIEMLTGIKNNYLQFVQMAAERKPSWASQAIKDKVSGVIADFASYQEDRGGDVSPLILKALDKMLDAPIAQVDALAL